MKKIKVTLFAAVLMMAACNSSPADKAKAEKESYENAMKKLEEKEKTNPVMFLSVSSSDKNNLLGQTVIKGNVTNTAKVSSYKDVELEVSFYSKTGTLLEKGNETVYDEILPGTSSPFKFKNFAPKGTDSVSIKVVGAKTK